MSQSVALAKDVSREVRRPATVSQNVPLCPTQKKMLFRGWAGCRTRMRVPPPSFPNSRLGTGGFSKLRFGLLERPKRSFVDGRSPTGGWERGLNGIGNAE